MPLTLAKFKFRFDPPFGVAYHPPNLVIGGPLRAMSVIRAFVLEHQLMMSEASANPRVRVRCSITEHQALDILDKLAKDVSFQKVRRFGRLLY